MRQPSDADGHGALDTLIDTPSRGRGVSVRDVRDPSASRYADTRFDQVIKNVEEVPLREKNLFAMQRAGAAMAYAATRRMKKPSAHHSGGTGSFEIMMNWKCPSAFSEKKAAL